MISVEVVVRDGSGEPVDLTELGVDRLVELIRARPPDDGAPPGSDLDRAITVWGAARLCLEGVESAARLVAALRAACIGAVADHTPQGRTSDQVIDELMTELVVSRRSAQYTRNQAEMLRAWPRVWAALAAGQVDTTRGVILARALLEIPPADPDGAARPTYDTEFEDLLESGLAYASQHTARRLALFLRRRLHTLGCPDRNRRHRSALAQRGVWIAHDGEGTAELTARLSSQDAERVYSTIRAIALADRNGEPERAGCPDPTEPLDTWLAAALVDTVLGSAAPREAEPAPSGAGTPANGAAHDRTARPTPQAIINVTIPVESLAGLTDQPGILNEFGIIPADLARQLAGADSRWRHVLTCRATGAILDVGTLSYRPPAALARHVRMRDGTCRFPGCSVPATECDLDHLIPFPKGPTSAANLHALCRRHHNLKHEGNWQVDATHTGGLRWTSPQGATATTHPDDTWEDNVGLAV